jgi:hypothetical protein
MNNYYIKNIWGPGGQEGYPHKDRTEFAKGQKQAAQHFSECDGFFLYETSGKRNDKIGAKSIFAQGIVRTPSEIITNQDEQKYGIERGEEKIFPYYVKVNLSIKINPLNGVPLDAVRAILKSPKECMQRHGGLIKITKEQFDQLSIELNKRI